MKYTYSSDEDTEGTGSRRSLRSRRESPAATSGPTFTASGRQIRKPVTGSYGESVTNGRGYAEGPNGVTSDVVVNGGPMNGRRTRGSSRGTYNFDDTEDDAPSGYENEEDYHATDADDESDEVSDGDDDSLDLDAPRSLVVKLPISKEKLAQIGDKLNGVNGAEAEQSEKMDEDPPALSNGAANGVKPVAETAVEAGADATKEASPVLPTPTLTQDEADMPSSKAEARPEQFKDTDVDMDRPLEQQRPEIAVT